MPILIKGTTYATGNQVTATNLNALVDSATFDTGAVDGSTTQLSGGAIIVKDGGITSAKLATNIAVSGTLSVAGTATFGTTDSGFNLSLKDYNTGTDRPWSIRDDSGIDRLRFSYSSADYAFWDVTKTAAANTVATQYWYAATGHEWQVGGSAKANISSTGLAVTGTLASSGIGAIGTTTSSTTSLNLPASTTGVSTLRVAHGSAPTSPVNGDIWTTTAGLYVRINGATVGPLS